MDSPKIEPEYTELHVIRKNFLISCKNALMAKARGFILQPIVIRTSLIKQFCICHADTIHLLHVAYTEQSAYQTCSPISTHVAVSASD